MALFQVYLMPYHFWKFLHRHFLFDIIISFSYFRDYENLEKRKSPVPLEEDCQPVIKSVDMDEIYDYENDDAKEVQSFDLFHFSF